MAAQLPLVSVAGGMGLTAVFLLIIIEPLFGLGLALLLGPLGVWEANMGNPLPLDSGQLMLLLTLAVWLGRALSRREISIPHSPLFLPLLVFVWITAVSLTFSPSFPLAFKEWAKWVEIGLIIWIVASEEKRRRPLILAMLLAAGVSQALLGIWQFGLQSDGPVHFLVLGRFYRAYGTFQQPNPFGGFMNLSALLAMGATIGFATQLFRCVALPKCIAPKQWLTLLTLAAVTGIATIGVLVSWSRGAWLGFAAGTAVLFLFLPRKRWQGALLMAGMGVGVITAVYIGQQLHIAAAESVIARLGGFAQDLTFGDMRGMEITNTNYAVVERLAHWQAAMGMANDNVWLGIGFGNYAAVYAEYALINWPDALGHAHNYYLNLLSEIGVVGLIVYLWLWTAVFIQTIRTINHTDGLWRGVALGLLAAWTAIAVHHLVDKLYVNNIYIHLGVMLGLLQLIEPASGKLQVTSTRPLSLAPSSSSYD